MNKENTEILTCKVFLIEVKEKVAEGLSYFDAMQEVAMIQSGNMMTWLSIAINKYEEATYHITALSKQSNVDECALASMGMLWHGENFHGSSIYIESTQKEIILDSFYFILKYAETNNPLDDALEANNTICGDHKMRERLIRVAFEKSV
jgi:hypothetical protein